MRLWRRDGVQGGRARQAGRFALFAIPIVAVAVLALAATGVMSTLAQFTASITNSNNHVQSGSVGLTEGHNGVDCPAPGNGQWTPCGDINKYGGGTLATDGSTSQTVTLQNTGTLAARLFLLPSACTDSLTGAEGELCNLVTVAVACTNGGSIAPAETLNDFFARRDYPTGYPMGTIAAGQTITCTFTLIAGSIPAPGGSISQPLAWRLTP